MESPEVEGLGIKRFEMMLTSEPTKDPYRLGNVEITIILTNETAVSEEKRQALEDLAQNCLVLSRFDAAPVSHLCGLSFEGQWAFPA